MVQAGQNSATILVMKKCRIAAMAKSHKNHLLPSLGFFNVSKSMPLNFTVNLALTIDTSLLLKFEMVFLST